MVSLVVFAADNPAVRNEAGVRALATGDLKRALADFEFAARARPDDPKFQFNVGLVLVRMGRPEQAIRHLERAISDPSTVGEARYLLGLCAFQLGDYGKVESALGGFADGPNAERSLYMLEESARLSGRQAEARERFRELNRRFPDGAWTHYLVGAAYENAADLEKAVEEYKAALARDPNLPNAAFAVGYLYWRQKDPETARQWFEKQLATQPCHALSLFYLGQIAHADRDEHAAAREYRRSLACDADSPEAHLRLGLALAELNQNDEAVRELKRAVQLSPDYTNAHYRLALLYRKLGREAESKAEYEIVRRLHAKEDGSGSMKP